MQKIQQNCRGQNNAINDRVNYNQYICSVPIAKSEPIQLPSSSVNGWIKVQLFKFGLKLSSLCPLHFVKNGRAGDVHPIPVPRLNEPIVAENSIKCLCFKMLKIADFNGRKGLLCGSFCFFLPWNNLYINICKKWNHSFITMVIFTCIAEVYLLNILILSSMR